MHRFVLLFLLVLLTACSGSSSSGPSASFSGTYRATVTLVGSPQVASGTVTCSQTGAAVGCTYNFPGIDAGTIDGTVSGSQFSGTGRSSRDPTPCPISGDLESGGATFTGRFSCPGQGLTLDVQATRV